MEPSTFTDYRLLIDDARVDSGFKDVTFSFKVGCDDDLDCAEAANLCPPLDGEDVDIDYLALLG